MVEVPKYGGYVAAAEVEVAEQPVDANSPASRVTEPDGGFSATQTTPAEARRVSVAFVVKDDVKALREKSWRLGGAV